MSRRGRKVDIALAVVASTAVLGVGTALTVAAWNDEEWVFASNEGGDGPGIGTSVFEVQQDVTNPYSPPGDWSDAETNPGNSLLFGLGALALAPGDTVYAPVALSTRADSLGGTLVLQPAVAADGIDAVDAGGLLWNALVVSVRAVDAGPTDAPPACDADGFASFTAPILINTAASPGLSSGTPTAGPALEAQRGNVVHYCFEISLPSGADTELMGRTVAPAWQFYAESTP